MLKFETYKGNNTEFYFRLIDSANKILSYSEGYKQKETNQLKVVDALQ